MLFTLVQEKFSTVIEEDEDLYLPFQIMAVKSFEQLPYGACPTFKTVPVSIMLEITSSFNFSHDSFFLISFHFASSDDLNIRCYRTYVVISHH
jgi:hypothetical protein